MRPAAAVALALAGAALACGGGDDAAPDAGRDAGLCIDCDARPPDGGVGYRWQLTPATATRLYVFEDQSPLAAGRSTRVAVEHAGLSCDLGAMPEIAITAADRTVVITPRVFARQPSCTLTAGQTRIVTLALGAGTWTVRGAGLAAALTLTVGPPPARACGVAPCTLDCDCDIAAGERCLGAMGLGGAFTTCTRPCEHDRDCAGAGASACVDLADGPFRICDPQPECTAAFPCPTGFACAPDAVCEPSFTLSASTRVACDDDRACAAGLRCVVAATGDRARCEAACRTGGGWCQGAHACGPASADLAGLAASDSVCGFLGD